MNMDTIADNRQLQLFNGTERQTTMASTIEFGEVQGDGGNGSTAIVKLHGEEIGEAVKVQGLWEPPPALSATVYGILRRERTGFTRLAQLGDAMDCAVRLGAVLARFDAYPD